FESCRAHQFLPVYGVALPWFSRTSTPTANAELWLPRYFSVTHPLGALDARKTASKRSETGVWLQGHVFLFSSPKRGI
ncbi:MAG: hypothetical protein JSW09_00480, partial [Pseudomonadota bacterium]